MSETELKKWSVQPIIRILEGVRQIYPDVPVIIFPRGAGVAYVDYAKRNEINCVSLDHSVTLKWAKDILQPKSVVQGNLDPMLLIEGETKMFKEAERILSTLSRGPLIFNLGHGILPNIPVDHAKAFVDAVKEYQS